MSFELPIFPLQVVLFPGMPLPLHIFEPRYRLMVQRCLEADRTFGVTLLHEAGENDPGASPALVGTATEIIEIAPFADGRMNLQTLGTRRFEMQGLRSCDGYLVGECRWLEDEAACDGTVRAALHARLTLTRYFDALARNTELPAQLGELDVPQDPYGLSMFIAAIMTLPLHQKQTLLELTSTRERLELEDFLLERAELVQRAFTKHIAASDRKPNGEGAAGYFSGFASLN